MKCISKSRQYLQRGDPKFRLFMKERKKQLLGTSDFIPESWHRQQ